MRNNKKSFSFKGKGYYIALILCAVAIGITGYLYYQNTREPSPSNQDLPSSQLSGNPQDVETNVTTPPVTDGSTPPTTEGEKPRKITRPVSGETVMAYAMEVLSYNPTTRDWRVHNGIDIAAEGGTSVVAAADGTVYSVYEDETMGTTVVIRHDGGYMTKYASLLKEVKVAIGDKVTSGQVIGTVGCTALLETALGDHLHFSVTLDGKAIDPNEFLSAE